MIERFGPSILVDAGNQKLLFDCGRGATQRLYQLKVPFNEVDALFLTHLHSDLNPGFVADWMDYGANGSVADLGPQRNSADDFSPAASV